MVIGGSAKTEAFAAGGEGASLAGDDRARVQKGESLTRKLLSFSRRRTLSPQVIDLAACNLVACAGAGASVQGDVELDFRMPASRSREARPERLEIALLTSTLNARATPCRTAQDRDALTRAKSPSAGMPANLQETLPWSQSPTAAPAFRTLSRAHLRAVLHHQAGLQRHRAGAEPGVRLRQPVAGRGHGGRSQEGRGARFTLFLPVSDEVPPSTTPAAKPPAATAGAGTRAAGGG